MEKMFYFPNPTVSLYCMSSECEEHTIQTNISFRVPLKMNVTQVWSMRIMYLSELILIVGRSER